MDNDQLLQWLLDGDAAVQYQVNRDLLGQDLPTLKARIAKEGWGYQFLKARNETGHWGRGFYQVKWISSHYTLLDLKHLGLPPDHPTPMETINIILRENKEGDGGINPGKTVNNSDV